MRNQLSLAKSYELTKWIELNREKLLKLQLKEATRRANKELPFDVTEGNMQGAARILNIQFSARANATKAIGHSRDSCRTLAQFMVTLANDLNVEVPESVLAIAAR